jgi:methylphosphotriester-DNA--protein-cysteine methyltransferase
VEDIWESALQSCKKRVSIMGYQDASNFTRTCVSRYGETPKQFRKNTVDSDQ